VSTPVLAALAGFAGVPALLAIYILGVERLLRLASMRRRRALQPWLWLAPALLFVAVFLAYPVVYTLVLSFLGAASRGFVGLANYRFALTNPGMVLAFQNTLLWLVGFSGAALFCGLTLALLTDRVPYGAAARTVLFLPQTISFVAAGVTWKFMYAFRPAGDPQIGVLNALLVSVGRTVHPVAWLVVPWVNTFALIFVAVWVWTGFCVVVLLAALRAIPPDLIEAARVDGTSEWQLLRAVTLPLLGPTIGVVTTTLVIFALRAFDIIYVMTSGNFGTEVIASRMYKEMFTFQNFGRASAIAMLLLAATSPAIFANVRRFRRPPEEAS
jgi:alpha-glucoside transport system permease protein